MAARTDTKMVKSIGEHWVCAELARRGWAPALTRDGLRRTDILAVSDVLPGRPRIEVQVKSATEGGNTNWPLGRTIGHDAESDFEWFILVTIPSPGQSPTAYVVPRDHVTAAAHIAHEDWRTDPTASAGTRNAPVKESRVAAKHFAGYRERWDLLDQPTSAAPVLLPSGWRALAQDQRVGLPEGHPWRVHRPTW